MSSRGIELAVKRERLIARSALQRAALAQQSAVIAKPLALADRGLAAARLAGRHPVLVAAAVAALVVWRPRKAVRVLQYGWMGWQMLRRVRSA